MGYSTDFSGEFALDKQLALDHFNYLKAFANARHVLRDEAKAAKVDDPLRMRVNLPVGTDGEFMVSADDGPDVIDYNVHPKSQPALWCQWVPNETGTAIEWDGGEKFYEYVKWLDYIIAKFLKPWGYVLNGEVEWEGQDSKDKGLLIVKDNVVTTRSGRTVYGKPKKVS